jgi:hypothetical protein
VFTCVCHQIATLTIILISALLYVSQPGYHVQVKFPDSTIQPALAPFVSLINHSPWPHIVHFSTVNPKTKTLDLTTFRTLQQGQQAFLSYGPLPNAQLLLFYGFAVESNPFEEATLTVQWPMQQQQQQDVRHQEAAAALLQELGLWPHQQQQQFTLTVQQPLPPGLLPCLRVMCATAEELAAVQQALKRHNQQQRQEQQQHGRGSSSGKPGNRSSNASRTSSKPKQAQGGSSSSEVGPSSPAELQAAWAAAAASQAVLGKPLSDVNEAAAQQQLQQHLVAARQPYEACLTKINNRRQLQVLLQGRQGDASVAAGSSSSSASEEGSFLQGLEALCRGLVGLYDACEAAAAASQRVL